MGRSRGGQMGNVSLDPLGRARRCTPGLPIRLLRSWAGVHSPFPVRSDGAPGRGRVQSWCPVLLNARGTPRGDSQPRLPGACLTPSKGRKSHSWSVTTGPRQCRRDGGIGRRGGLKNLWASALAGSSPAPGIFFETNNPPRSWLSVERRASSIFRWGASVASPRLISPPLTQNPAIPWGAIPWEAGSGLARSPPIYLFFPSTERCRRASGRAIVKV